MPGILVEIIGNATQFKKELDSAVVATNKANTGFARMQKAAGIAGLALAGGLAIGLDKSVHAAMQAEQQTARLEQAFKTSGVSIDRFTGAISEAEKSSRNLGFTNADVRDALGSLVIATHSGSKAIKELSVAEDIARFKHTSLSAATKILTMAQAGSQRATKQLGLTIEDGGTKQERAAKVIELVSQKLHGQAQAYSETAAGGAAQFHAQVDALEEGLGAGLLPALTMVAGALATVAGFLAEHQTLAKVLVAALATLATTLIAISVATKAWAAAQVLLNVALSANPIGVVIVAVAALAAGIIYAYTHSEKFRAIVTGAFNAVKAAATFVLDFFRHNWPIIATLISGPFAPIVALATNAFGIRSALVGAVNAILDFFRDHWKTIAVLISGPFAPLVALATDAFGIRSALVGAFEAVAQKAGELWKKVYNAMSGPINLAIALVQKLLDIIHAVTGAVEGLISAIGRIHVPHIPHLPGIPGFAGGVKNFKGGWAVVGEKGPELLQLPAGSSVSPVSGSSTFGAVGGGGSTVINVNMPNYLGAPREAAEEIRRELIKIGRRNGGDVLGGLA